MKTIILITSLLFSYPSFSGYGKPELLARYSGMDAYNAPTGLSCFSSEPLPTPDGVFLGCQNSAGTLMVRWSPKFEVLAQTPDGLFSHPKEVDGKVSWYEFSEAGLKKVHDYRNRLLSTTALGKLGSLSSLNDSFIPLKYGAYIYRSQDDTAKSLNIWKDRAITALNFGEVSYIFPPVISTEGAGLVKIRRGTTAETAPDELILLNEASRVLLKDRDADPTSGVRSFRHQYALDQGAAAVFITDERGEALVIIKLGRVTEVARAGKELKSFDYFAPKMRNGILVFRGVDFQNRKALYLYENSQLRVLLTQGDHVETDKGPAQVNYQSPDAVLYGAPGISAVGDVYQQATLTETNAQMSLLGIGLLKFKKE